MRVNWTGRILVHRVLVGGRFSEEEFYGVRLPLGAEPERFLRLQVEQGKNYSPTAFFLDLKTELTHCDFFENIKLYSQRNCCHVFWRKNSHKKNFSEYEYEKGWPQNMAPELYGPTKPQRPMM